MGRIPWTGRLSLFVLLCVGGMLVSGCSSSAETTSGSPPSPERSWTPAEAESRLRAAAARWDSTPHQLGGTSQRGVDCSGLVQSVFTTEFRVRVPRTTEQQARTGRSVPRAQLRPGDLVFFRPEWKERHVGIYLSDGEFLHASSSSGVTVSNLRRDYWTERWWQARRLLPMPADSTRASSSPDRDASSTVGW
ncbi:MAG: NlpC/P60 family protein [Salinivenus sp.]